MTEEPKEVPILIDALRYPLTHIGWLLVIVGAASAGFGVLSLKVLSVRLVLILMALVGVVVRVYFSIIENTLTGWGQEAWQGAGLRFDDLWDSLGNVIGIAFVAWLPTGAIFYWMAPHQPLREELVTLTSALGCEYFCMGLMALIALGSFTEALPHRVIPAILRCGPAYMLAGAGLMLIPVGIRLVASLVPEGGFGAWMAVAAAGGYFLMAHARLVGRIYLANRERVGW
ncbi:MAG: hypothetical protein H7A55_14155 [Verrucomicrobiaceae bacterium]|nr:hypothetical protein [Verrucomicrobiaceae bacterium]